MYFVFVSVSAARALQSEGYLAVVELCEKCQCEWLTILNCRVLVVLVGRLVRGAATDMERIRAERVS
jgi:hypothetical protein